MQIPTYQFASQPNDLVFFLMTYQFHRLLELLFIITLLLGLALFALGLCIFLLFKLRKEVHNFMSTTNPALDKLQSDVAALTTEDEILVGAVTDAVTEIGNLRTQISALQAAGSADPTVLAAMDASVDAVQTSLQAAVTQLAAATAAPSSSAPPAQAASGS